MTYQKTAANSGRRRGKPPKGDGTIRAIAVTLATLILATAAHAEPRAAVPLNAKIEKARANTHRCQRQLGLDPDPVSTKPVRGTAYARWVLALWQTRADAYCTLARSLTDSGILREIVNPCLAAIVGRETAGTWSPTIYNYGGSGAYGLPQALPGHKMASAGADWRTNPLTQLRWMVGYTTSRYGSPCGALAFHNANGWY